MEAPNIDIQREIADCYQPLFSLMVLEHDLVLLQQQMDEIIVACEKVKKGLVELRDHL